MSSPIFEEFIERAKEKLIPDLRLKGLLAGGSMMTGTLDEYSDLDLIIAYDSAYREEIMDQRLIIAEGLGNLLSAFTGEHVGEPRLVICLYGPEPLHVDLKFVTVEELEPRIENPLVLWERGSEIIRKLAESAASHPAPSPQWMEDRFWVWVHYGAAKLGRGELFEAIDMITFMRNSVLGPLILMRNGRLPRGVRRLETYATDETGQLKDTIPSHDAESCYRALKNSICIYQQLRQPTDGLVIKKEAELASIAYLEKVYSSLVE